MKILVEGGLGSIGRRYCAVLKYLGHQPLISDPRCSKDDPRDLNFEKVIIAVPTSKHFGLCKFFIEKGHTFLCEKPLSRDLKECEELVKYGHGFVVNNLAFVARKYHRLTKDEKLRIHWNYYNHGKDTLEWDLSQIIYLDPLATLHTTSPVWRMSVNDVECRYRDVEESYIEMIEAFVDGRKEDLWTLEDGLKMSQAVQRRIDESRNIHSGTN